MLNKLIRIIRFVIPGCRCVSFRIGARLTGNGIVFRYVLWLAFIWNMSHGREKGGGRLIGVCFEFDFSILFLFSSSNVIFRFIFLAFRIRKLGDRIRYHFGWCLLGVIF